MGEGEIIEIDMRYGNWKCNRYQITEERLIGDKITYEDRWEFECSANLTECKDICLNIKNKASKTIQSIAIEVVMFIDDMMPDPFYENQEYRFSLEIGPHRNMKEIRYCNALHFKKSSPAASVPYPIAAYVTYTDGSTKFQLLRTPLSHVGAMEKNFLGNVWCNYGHYVRSYWSDRFPEMESVKFIKEGERKDGGFDLDIGYGNCTNRTIVGVKFALDVCRGEHFGNHECIHPNLIFEDHQTIRPREKTILRMEKAIPHINGAVYCEFKSGTIFYEDGSSQTWNPNTAACYVATCVYGSYGCPQVWTLRRFRDDTLAKSWYGRAFIRTYYAVSPTLVKWFGKTDWFKNMWKPKLDRMVRSLQEKGVESTPYDDPMW